MSRIVKKVEVRPGEYRIKKKIRRRKWDVKRNLMWAGIILVLTLILGIIVGGSSSIIDKYFSSSDEAASVPKDMTKKLKDLDIDKLLRERERLKR